MLHVIERVIDDLAILSCFGPIRYWRINYLTSKLSFLYGNALTRSLLQLFIPDTREKRCPKDFFVLACSDSSTRGNYFLLGKKFIHRAEIRRSAFSNYYGSMTASRGSWNFTELIPDNVRQKDKEEMNKRKQRKNSLFLNERFLTATML